MNAVSAAVTHNNAETLFVEAAGVRFAYRRFGRPGELPLVMLQHFRDNDLMIPSKLSHLLAGLIPDARIRIYPDAAHGFLFQYPAEVAAEVNAFLAGGADRR
jgi:hypothetical protein